MKEEMEFEDLEEEQEQPMDMLPRERRIHSEKKDLSIFELCRQKQKGKLKLQPDFQRFQVWDNRKSSRLIESILLEVPIPVIYLSAESSGEFSVIDGQQRLDAFIRFHKNELKLSGLRDESLNGKTFEELGENLQNKFENTSIQIILIREDSDPNVKFEIFERLNTGSVQLNAQELRNCIYRGRYNELLYELSLDSEFQSLLGLEKPHSRMQDRELILRFFAFYQSSYHKYTSSMKHFLNKEMESRRNIDDSEVDTLKKIFKKSVKLSKTVFGNKAFKRFVAGLDKDHNGNWERKLNKGLSDIIMADIIMAGFIEYQENQVIPNSDAIREKLLWLMTYDESFINSISGSGTDNKEKVRTRFEKWLSTMKEIIGAFKSITI